MRYIKLLKEGKTKITQSNTYREIPSKTNHRRLIETPEYKKYRRKWEQYPQDHIVDNFPIHLDFEITTYCNLNCQQKICTLKCPFDLPDDKILPKINFDIELFKKIINEGVRKGLLSIKLNYRGEPLLHPKITEFITYAKQQGILDVMLNSNSSLLSGDLSLELLNSSLDKLFCALGPISESKINLLRGTIKTSKIIKNIQNFMSLKRKMAILKPIVTIQVFDMGNNKEQLKSFIKRWETIVENVAIDKLSKFILENDFLSNDCDFTCQYLWQRLFILYNGDVVMCCGNHKKNDVLGNLRDQSIESIWKGAKLERIRKLHLEGKSGKLGICRKCGFRKTVINNEINNNK